MEKRKFGQTGHQSSVAILGGFAFSQCTQEETDELMEKVLDVGVNHIDVAPTYGHAEERLGPWLARERERFFLGCKTMERTKDGAAKELRESLERLQTDHFDLYQIHAITKGEELEAALGPNGALEAIQEAQSEGLTRFIGITGHGVKAPELFLTALERFDFDSVLFPINYVQYGDAKYWEDTENLLELCQEREVGTMIIKSITKGPWGEKPHTHITWYEPFTEPDRIQEGVNFALSQNVTGICTAGDPQLLPKVLQACENFRPLNEQEQEALLKKGAQYEPLFT